MSSAITEVLNITFKPGIIAEGYIKQLFETFQGQKGYQGGVWGYWEDAHEKVQMFHQWDSIASSHAFVESDDLKAKQALFAPVVAEPPSIHHVHFDDKLSEVLNAPMTEVATFYGPDENFEAFDFQDFSKILQKPGNGFFGFSTGAAIEELELGGEKFKAVNILAGWESVKAHEDAYKTFEQGDVLQKFGSAFQGLKGRAMHHVKLVKG